jgi:hypothetical protein
MNTMSAIIQGFLGGLVGGGIVAIATLVWEVIARIRFERRYKQAMAQIEASRQRQSRWEAA